MLKSKKFFKFEKLDISGCQYLEDDQSKSHVFHVTTPHSLTQAAGYLKYIYGKEQKQVFLRGQQQIWPTLSPTLLRGIKNQNAQSRRNSALREACRQIASNNNIFDGVPVKIQEALFQHYGLKTSWIDLVDNVWVALWFACHSAHSAGKIGEFLHFERRDPYSDKNPFAYILLIAVDMHSTKPFVPGYFSGPTTELIDLRVSVPSIFLRPHAQHGVLFRLKGGVPRRAVDYSDQIVGIIRISLRDALVWLGDGKFTGTHSLFPPAYYDRGYELLLKTGFQGDRAVGAIHHVGT